MEKIILFSDLHLTAGDRIIGLDPVARFDEAATSALADHPDASHIIFMGDLTHHGTVEEYALLKQRFDNLPLPFTAIPGNHDRRAPFEQVFGSEFQQSRLTTQTHSILCLDTLDESAPDTHSGWMDKARLTWVQDMLDQSDLPVIVIMHHALTKTFFDGMDAIALRNGEVLGDILATSGKVRHIINGHIHRTIFTSHQSIPVAMIKSTCHQMPLVIGHGSSSLSIVEPSAYGILCLTDEHAVLHVEDVGLPRSE